MAELKDFRRLVDPEQPGHYLYEFERHTIEVHIVPKGLACVQVTAQRVRRDLAASHGLGDKVLERLFPRLDRVGQRVLEGIRLCELADDVETAERKAEHLARRLNYMRVEA